MKAVLYTEYGSPDVLQYTDVEKPTPTDDQVLVKIHAASANPLDWHHMRGEPSLARIEDGLRRPKPTILGADLAGRVEAVGKNVRQFKVGDDVFGGVSGKGLGGFAEYVCTSEERLALKPNNVSFEQAAAVLTTGYTAIQGLRDAGHIKSGQTVLINGAAGGIGTFAVQFAKSCGATVTGVCSTSNVEMVRSIGADHVVDYTREDFTKTGQHYDLIFDTVGNRSVGDMKRALNPNGASVVAGFTTMTRLLQVVILGKWVSRRGTQKIGLMGTARQNKQDLEFIQSLLESGKIIPVIDRCYPLRETAEAIRYLEAGHAKGKVVINVV